MQFSATQPHGHYHRHNTPREKAGAAASLLSETTPKPSSAKGSLIVVLRETTDDSIDLAGCTLPSTPKNNRQLGCAHSSTEETRTKQTRFVKTTTPILFPSCLFCLDKAEKKTDRKRSLVCSLYLPFFASFSFLPRRFPLLASSTALPSFLFQLSQLSLSLI